MCNEPHLWQYLKISILHSKGHADGMWAIERFYIQGAELWSPLQSMYFKFLPKWDASEPFTRSGVFISSCVVTLLVCWQHVFEAGFMQSFFSWYFQVKYRDLLRSTWHRPFQRTLLSLNPGRGIRISAILASRLVSTMPDMLLGHGFSWFIGKYPLQKCIRTQFCVF